MNTVIIADIFLGRRYRTMEVVSHPRFNSYNNDYDVGLLRTVTDIDMEGKEEERWLHLSAELAKKHIMYLVTFINTVGKARVKKKKEKRTTYGTQTKRWL